MDKKRRNILSYVFWAAVAVVLVWFCLRSIDWVQFRQALEQCRWEWVLAAMALGLLSLLVRGLRWRMLLLPIDPGTSVITCFNAYNICTVVNLALPRAGELARLVYVVKNSSVGADGKRLMTVDKALGTVVVERVWDMVFVALLALVIFVFKWEDFGTYLGGVFDGIQIGPALWALVIGLLLLIPVAILLFRSLRKRGGIWARIWGFLEGIGRGLGSFRHMKRGWLFLLYTLLIWTLYWFISACILWALKDMEVFAPLTLSDALFLSFIGALSSMIPVPGGFGAYHTLVAGALKNLWNIPMGTGMIYATLNHESQVFIQALAGLASYIHESFFRTKK